MKLKTIRIVGMHNVVDKTYNVNDVLTYFKGPNGAGKSTALEAIQLVLLGYIPGYAKTNEGIMKHSSGKELQVIGTFDNGTTIIRKWVRSGSSVKSSIESIPTMDLSDFRLVDEQLELPIYNFNDFKDLTANKLKEWFLSFLPSEVDAIDWESRLKDSLESRVSILSDELMDSVLNQIKNLSASYKGLELIQNLNTYLKSEQSYTKKEIERLEGTVQSLVYYDEELPSSAEDAKAEIERGIKLLTELSEYESKITHVEAVNRKLSSLTKVDVNTTAKDIEEVESYIEARNNLANIHSKLEEFTARDKKLREDLADKQRELKELSRIKDSKCPYTSIQCAEIQKIVDSNKDKIAQINLDITAVNVQLTEVGEDIRKTRQEEFDANNLVNEISSQYRAFFELKEVAGDTSSIERPTQYTREQISGKIKQLQESLSKIEANKKYNELIEQITKDKFNAQNNLEVLKIWVKLTDANGLQTELMSKPFENLAEDMNKYLTVMFGRPITARFNLSGKANSFSFGLVENDSYIEFDYLSSGERCLFTLAMMICILDKSNTTLKTILVDDLVDHLDDANAQNVFEALTKVKEVQFILAGVKTCNVEGVVDVQL